jgi:hypothetical protein
MSKKVGTTSTTSGEARGDGSYNPVNAEGRREELPMNEDALRSWFWAAVIVLALAIWVIWGMVVGI